MRKYIKNYSEKVELSIEEVLTITKPVPTVSNPSSMQVSLGSNGHVIGNLQHHHFVKQMKK